MANEIVQGLLGNLLQPQQQGPSPADIMAAVTSSNPMAAAMALNTPSMAQVFGRGARGLLGAAGIGQGQMSAEEALAQSMAQADLTTSNGLKQAAQNALTVGNRPLALQLTLQAQQLQAEEQKRAQDTARTQLQVGTTVQYLKDLIEKTDNTQARAEIAALVSPAASGADQKFIIEQADKVLERYKIELTAPDALKGEVIDYMVPTPQGPTRMSLTTYEDGDVRYNGVKQAPDALGLTRAPSLTSQTTRVDESVGPANVQSLLQRASVMGYLPDDPTNPVSQSIIQAINTNQIKTFQDLDAFVKDMPGTPVQIAREQQVKENTLARIRPAMNNMDQALDLILDPVFMARTGNVFSFSEDMRLGTRAQQLRDALLPVRSAAALNEITTLKAEAQALGSTGTGLGSVAVREFEALETSTENLNTAQTPQQIKQAGLDYAMHLYNVRNLARGEPILATETDPVYEGLARYRDPQGRSYVILNDRPVFVEFFNSAEEAVSTLRRAR